MSIISTLKAQFWHPNSLRYSIVENSAFKIDEFSGKLYLVEPLDREVTSRVSVIIQCRSKLNPKIAKMELEVLVMDINDNVPTFTENPGGMVPSEPEAR